MQDVDVLITAPHGVAMGGQVFRYGQRVLLTRGEALTLRQHGLARVVRFIASSATPLADEGEPDAE